MAKDKVRSILVTGFDPFGGMDVNSSWLAVKALPDEIAGRQIIKLELPTVFGKAGEALYAAVKAHQPEAVICVGQSGESAKVRLERLAINLIDARIPDNEGNQPVDVPVREDAPDAYFTRLPVTKLLQALEDNDISAEISLSAGTFVCNYVMYELLHLLKRKYKNVPGGFIHVPQLSPNSSEPISEQIPEQQEENKEQPEAAQGMSLDKITEAILVCIGTLCSDIDDNSKQKKKSKAKEAPDVSGSAEKSNVKEKDAEKPKDKAPEKKPEENHEKKSKEKKPKDKKPKEKSGPNAIEKGQDIVRKNAPKVKHEMKKLAENPVVKDVAFEALDVAHHAIRNRKVRKIVGAALRAARKATPK